jgi:demethylmenaquinone methyltransferase/2-methoxy-6-polyprenyl-1,4-benzoquinol methylase
MGNKYFEPGAQRAAKVKDLFATIAPRYDLINDLQSFGLHRWWKRRLIQLARPQPGERALDLCCGTGDIAFGLARAGADVVGVDFSDAMLAIARRRAESVRLPSVVRRPQFLQGDAEQLAFPEDHFDIVTVGYGLRNLTSWERGLAEMRRVTKPGGRMLVLDFGKPELGWWRRVYFGYLRCVVPMFGRMCCGDPATHAYILESLLPYPAQRGVAAKMREMECSDVKVVELLGGVMSINYGRK